MARNKAKKKYFSNKRHQYNSNLGGRLFWIAANDKVWNHIPLRGVDYLECGAVIYVNGVMFDIVYIRNGVLQSVPHTEDFYRYIEHRHYKKDVISTLGKLKYSVVVVGIVMNLDKSLSVTRIYGINNIKLALSSYPTHFIIDDIGGSEIETRYIDWGFSSLIDKPGIIVNLPAGSTVY